MANTSRHIKLIGDSYQRKISFFIPISFNFNIIFSENEKNQEIIDAKFLENEIMVSVTITFMPGKKKSMENPLKSLESPEKNRSRF